MKKVIFRNIFKKNRMSGLSQSTKKKIVIIGAVLMCALFVVLIVSILSNRVNFDKAKAPIIANGMISIGLRTDVEGLAKKNPGTGIIEGFEADLAAEIVNRLFPEGINVQYKEINSKTGKVFIDLGEVDMTLAAYVPGSDVTYLIYSEPYYTDSVVFYAKKGGVASVDQLKGKRVGVVTTSYAGANLEGYMKDKGLSCTVVQYASYPDASDALSFGNIDAIAGSSVLIRPYAANFTPLNSSVMPHGYCIAIKKGKTELKKALDYILSELEKDGTLNRLEQKWQLPDYKK